MTGGREDLDADHAELTAVLDAVDEVPVCFAEQFSNLEAILQAGGA
ncbi:hypothetical protein DES52_11730 [Deinococcus yavapaiensis KR-236]|uniref:Uncharacterized protein n=2 Tax=Deinococcus TaxID=1298 RepID=A0A318SHL2_9DEIO|nr:hypothetical protein DES52_11730 [Deinococcus yavapaiensis KR-236]